MKGKKLIGGLLVACMVASSFLGCASKNNSKPATNKNEGTKQETNSGTTTKANELYNEIGQMPIVNEPITLTILATQDGENSREDNLQTKELEELTGIKIKWIIAPANSIREKMNLMFSSGDMPDIIMLGTSASTRLDKATEASLGAQGLILPLNEYYDTVSVGYKEAFERLDGLRDFITTPDGKIYSLPNVDGSLHVQYNSKLWINTTWLDNLGLEIPTTTDEFYDVLKAFKELDANGNGDLNDEIPLSTVKSGAGTQIDGFLMNPFQLSPENSRLYVDNGTVTFSPVQEGYKTGLEYLHKLYKEGLLNPESFTQDLNNQVNVNEGGSEAVIGAFLAQRPGYANNLSAEPNSKRWEQYQPLAPLKGPDGTAVAAWNPYVMYQSGQTFITTSCTEPEAAFRLIDYLATREGSYRSAFGIEGVHYRKAEAGEMGVDGKQAIITQLPDADLTNAKWDQLAGLVRFTEDTVGMTTNPDPYAEDVKPLSGRQIVMYRGSLEHEKVRQPLESVMPDLYQSEEEIEELSLIKTTVMDYALESMVRFVVGDLSIEKDWDSYKKQLDDLGLSRYLELLQKAYDESSFAK